VDSESLSLAPQFLPATSHRIIPPETQGKC
jgi:hypothetical protein